MKSLFATLLLLTSSLVVAECTQPALPEIPDGLEADLATMVEGQQAVKAFMAESDTYLDCLYTAAEAAAETDTEEQVEARNQQHDSWVDEMELVAEEFNQELRSYKEKNQ
ncbi:MAG: hypothetical protein OXC05_11540 [Halieaceae bacterium]|nr:hypothetical protein [Halieaceae bacterium]